MKPELTKKLADMAEQLKAISAELSEQSFTPVIGGWYLAESLMGNQYKIKLTSHTPVFQSKLWFSSDGNICNVTLFTKLIRPLTPEEVKELLVNECKRKYEGKKVRCLCLQNDSHELDFSRFDYNDRLDRLFIGKKGAVFGSQVVYNNGKFADIVEDVVKVGGFEVCKVANECVKIDKEVYSFVRIDCIKTIFQVSTIKSINWHGEDVTPEKLDQILKLFK